ncbi:hypothetical protein BS47DRAFT_1368244 [Hydnum rufescens UP504]|uniref:Uncharacterized protein n=1 Tax=Hydnum rufescens UP504 TaxID=1448309 RepID=A0A9P6DNE2_9AGAM|nr:hypothetical protein BS47DRAFT_1368244 [Hydnum rufescens UP504]
MPSELTHGKVIPLVSLDTKIPFGPRPSKRRSTLVVRLGAFPSTEWGFQPSVEALGPAAPADEEFWWGPRLLHAGAPSRSSPEWPWLGIPRGRGHIKWLLGMLGRTTRGRLRLHCLPETPQWGHSGPLGGSRCTIVAPLGGSRGDWPCGGLAALWVARVERANWTVWVERGRGEGLGRGMRGEGTHEKKNGGSAPGREKVPGLADLRPYRNNNSKWWAQAWAGGRQDWWSKWRAWAVEG